MTVRELQTLALVAEGKPYGVIAEHLHVIYKTVQYLHSAQGQAWRAHAARADVRHPASPLGHGEASQMTSRRSVG